MKGQTLSKFESTRNVSTWYVQVRNVYVWTNEIGIGLVPTVIACCAFLLKAEEPWQTCVRWGIWMSVQELYKLYTVYIDMEEVLHNGRRLQISEQT